jgi:hypothetical protein
MDKIKKKELCEAKYGEKNCPNEATKTVIASSMLFRLCKTCAKGVQKQSIINN